MKNICNIYIYFFFLEKSLESMKHDTNIHDLQVFTVSSVDYMKLSDRRYFNC
jgi:hypothetical protein